MTKNYFPRRMSESAYRHLFCYKKALVITRSAIQNLCWVLTIYRGV